MQLETYIQAKCPMRGRWISILVCAKCPHIDLREIFKDPTKIECKWGEKNESN